jgi:hypothetical protein
VACENAFAEKKERKQTIITDLIKTDLSKNVKCKRFSITIGFRLINCL